MQPRERLTVKEMQVAALVWEGQTNRDIAKAIGTTEQVVKNYLRSTFDKLGVWSRLELAIYVSRHGGEKWREEIATRSIEILPETIASYDNLRTGDAASHFSRSGEKRAGKAMISRCPGASPPLRYSPQPRQFKPRVREDLPSIPSVPQDA